jgi:hypothetical protein
LLWFYNWQETNCSLTITVLGKDTSSLLVCAVVVGAAAAAVVGVAAAAAVVRVAAAAAAAGAAAAAAAASVMETTFDGFRKVRDYGALINRVAFSLLLGDNLS